MCPAASSSSFNPENLEGIIERILADVESRTLEPLSGHFSRLIYLASLRDYNTGRYHHYGLETRYPSEAVDTALRRCHAKSFEELLEMPLEQQTADLLCFFDTLKEDSARLVETWRRLRAYQLLPPDPCPALARDLFEKNVQIMLEVLRETELWPLLHEPHGDPNNLP